MKYGNLTLGQLEAVVNIIGGKRRVEALLAGELVVQEREWPFPRNEKGHQVLTFTAQRLSSRDEYSLLQKFNYRVLRIAGKILQRGATGQYDVNHRLADGAHVDMALILHRDIPREFRTTEGILNYGRSFGYEDPPACLLFRILEMVSDEDMIQMGCGYISVLHEPIEGVDGEPRTFSILFDGGMQSVGAVGCYPRKDWNDSGAFGFVVPRSVK